MSATLPPECRCSRAQLDGLGRHVPSCPLPDWMRDNAALFRGPKPRRASVEPLCGDAFDRYRCARESGHHGMHRWWNEGAQVSWPQAVIA